MARTTYSKEPSCKNNPLLICSNHNACEICGWHPQENERRKKLRQYNGLSLNKKGKYFLKLPKGDAE